MLSDNWEGKNPYDVVTGFRDLMRACGYNQISQEPCAVEIQWLFEFFGNEAVFEKNSPKVAKALRLNGANVPSNYILDLLQTTETLDEFGLRGVRGPIELMLNESVILMLSGATIPWMERRVAQAKHLYQHGQFVIGGIYTLASGRQCTASTELNHPLAIAADEVLTENDALHRLIARAGLGLTGGVVGQKLETNVETLMLDKPALAHAKIVVPTNANATFIPLVYRRSIRKTLPDFDKHGDQLIFCQDSFPLARTPEQAADPAHFQRPLTMIPALIRLVNELFLLNGSKPLAT